MLLRILDRLEEIIIAGLMGAATVITFVAVAHRFLVAIPWLRSSTGSDKPSCGTWGPEEQRELALSLKTDSCWMPRNRTTTQRTPLGAATWRTTSRTAVTVGDKSWAAGSANSSSSTQRHNAPVRARHSSSSHGAPATTRPGNTTGTA